MLSLTVSLKAQDMEHQENITKLINQFAEAASERDTEVLEQILNSSFRVILSSDEKTVVIDRKAYIDMMKAGKIGGAENTVAIHGIQISGGTAAADVNFSTESTEMHMYLGFIREKGNRWTIVSDLPEMSKK